MCRCVQAFEWWAAVQITSADNDGRAGPENGFKLLISAVNDEDNNGNFRHKMAAPVPAHVCGYVCLCLCYCLCDFEK